MAACGTADVSERRPRTPPCSGAALACPANLALRGGAKKRWLAEDGAFEAPFEASTTQTQAGGTPTAACAAEEKDFGNNAEFGVHITF